MSHVKNLYGLQASKMLAYFCNYNVHYAPIVSAVRRYSDSNGCNVIQYLELWPEPSRLKTQLISKVDNGILPKKVLAVANSAK